MFYRHPVNLSHPRDIGWRDWDPIGLSTTEGRWDGSGVADEYDRYLLHLAARLQCGEAEGPLVDHLVHVETEHMGLTSDTTARSRAAATVVPMREYVSNLS